MNKSLFRRPGTKHFQLVHRSQRDPLIHDPSASDRVLKLVDAPQAQKKSLRPSSSSKVTEAEDDDEEEGTREQELGDAAAYGVFFDDTKYDYMQHLRTVGMEADSYLVEAPAPANKKGKSRAKDTDFEIRDPTPAPTPRGTVQLPDDVLPSHPLDEISYNDITSSAAPVGGLQPDLDPSIREVLEALDDEAYAVEEEGEDSGDEDAFWNGVVDGGELREGESHPDWVAELEASSSSAKVGGESKAPGEWDHIAQAKLARDAAAAGRSDDDEDDEDFGSDEEVDSDFGSEGADTIAALRVSNAKRPKRQVDGGSVRGSQFSMTSSAMFRNEGLRTLDDRFDEVERMYDDSDEEDEDSWDEENPYGNMPAPRSDLDQIMNDFLSRFEVLGGKMKHVLEPTPGVEGTAGKLDRIRRELANLDIGEEGVEGESEEVTARRREKERILKMVERQEREERKGGGKDRIERPVEQAKDRWDCETVLSTYSNVSNHPRMLRLRDVNGSGARPAKISVDDRGFPTVDGVEVVPGPVKKRRGIPVVEEEDEDMGGSDDEEYEEVVETIKRPKHETPEERKARKQAVKEERASRRTEKKATKEAFGNETKRQKKIAGRKVAGGVSVVLNKPYDAFADEGEVADVEVKETKKAPDSIHIRIQQRNGRKTITTLQGVPKEYDPKKLLKAFKKEFACNGSIVDDEEMGEVIQLQGDQRTKIAEMLIESGLKKDIIKIHGF